MVDVTFETFSNHLVLEYGTAQYGTAADSAQSFNDVSPRVNKSKMFAHAKTPHCKVLWVVAKFFSVLH